jgi:pimeloyl-ACP methyl ester carboxylesterase
MTTRHRDVKTGFVTTEGDSLYYEVRGSGQPLLMIPGGGGDGRVYSFIADLLSEEYKVITYDRRANSRSSANEPVNFEISQQSRDVVAVLCAAGENSAFVFGSSSGAVIALDMAKTQPQAVRAIVAHEPPITRVHPNARKWQRFFAGVYGTAFSLGTTIAMMRFILGVGLPLGLGPRPKASEKHVQEMHASGANPINMADYFTKQELLPVTNYMPDIVMIKKNGIKVFLAAGQESLDKKRFYAQTAPILAQRLECEMILFPGHHVSYVDNPKEWAAVLRTILHKSAGTNH